MSLLKLNRENFESEVLNRSGVALVDFYADWCGPCKMIAPVIEEVAQERQDVAVGKLNVDTDPELAAKYGVMSIPTLIVFKDGQEISRVSGYRPKQDVLSLLG